MGFNKLPPEGGMLSMLLDPRYRFATEAPVFRSSRAHRPDGANRNGACQSHQTGDTALAKIARKQPTKRKPLLIKPQIAAPTAPGDFVLDHALKLSGNRTAPWEND